MQKATTPKRFYIDHTADHKVEVRAVACAWPREQDHHAPVVRQPAGSQAERLFSAGRLIRGGFLRKR